MLSDEDAAKVAFLACTECTDKDAHWARLTDYAKDYYRNGGTGYVPPPDDIDEQMRKNFNATPAIEIIGARQWPSGSQ